MVIRCKRFSPSNCLPSVTLLNCGVRFRDWGCIQSAFPPGLRRESPRKLNTTSSLGSGESPSWRQKASPFWRKVSHHGAPSTPTPLTSTGFSSHDRLTVSCVPAYKSIPVSSPSPQHHRPTRTRNDSNPTQLEQIQLGDTHRSRRKTRSFFLCSPSLGCRSRSTARGTTAVLAYVNVGCWVRHLERSD